jgi:hypothetical protein
MKPKQFFLCMLLAVLPEAARTQTNYFFLVAPNDLADAEGDDYSYEPWTYHSIRYQQVFDASQFTGLATSSGGWIRNLYFRLDSDLGHTVATVFSNLQINLSTTQRTPDGLSSVFSENTGVDESVVFGPRPLTALVPYIEDGRPQPFAFFDIGIEPYFYDPAGGNLLMDIRFSSSFGGFNAPIDTSNVTGDSISSVWGAFDATSGTLTTEGLVTRFQVAVIPEPSSLLLWAAGAGLLLARFASRGSWSRAVLSGHRGARGESADR